MWGLSILSAIAGMWPRFRETHVPRGSAPSVSEDARRDTPALQTCLKALREAGGTQTKLFGGTGLAKMEDTPVLDLDYEKMDKTLLKAVRDIAEVDGTAELVNAFLQPVGNRMDYGNYQSLRWFIDLGLGGQSKPGLRGRDVYRIICERADAGDEGAEAIVEWVDAMQKSVSKEYGRKMEVLAATAIRVGDEGYSATHGDKKVGDARTVTVIMDEDVPKRVSFGLAKDPRGKGSSTFQPKKWIYLGDLVLSNGETYIGDAVAMGGVSVGVGSWWQGKSAVVHRVNPVEGEEWVLVIDWVAVEE